MNTSNQSNKAVWRKVWKHTIAGNKKKLACAMQFFKNHEKHCVSAWSRFLHRKDSKNRLWYLSDDNGKASAILFYSRRSLYPIYDEAACKTVPHFLERLVKRHGVYSIQGLQAAVQLFANEAARFGVCAFEVIDYDLMLISKERFIDVPAPVNPLSLVIRTARAADIDALYPLQAAYEQEEVLPAGAEFYPPACRANLEQLLKQEQLLVACIGNTIVGKINSNAASFNYIQIGGVFVVPEHRRKGIAGHMTRAFVRKLLAQGKEITLFVKKRNCGAHRLYEKLGFTSIGTYRISYY
ncbi:GNAT family N-acetyltransferase [Breznakiellaceae bacterium SP9]